MQVALQLAAEAATAGEVPVGAVVVKDGVVIGTGRNSPIASSDPSAHAEMLALRAAASVLGNYRMDGCTLYVTLEPCAMCSGAILHGRLERVVFAAADPKTGCAGSVLNLFTQPQLNHQTQLQGGLLAAQAGQLLADFFQQKRTLRRQTAVPLRDDALRTPGHCFDNLLDYPWQPHYLNDLPALSGLRLHYLDEGPADSSLVYLCLHPAPGWSYSLRHTIQDCLGQGARVLAPDLIGFGKSDKPKRQDFHSPALHAQYLAQWLGRLQAPPVILLVPAEMQALAATLAAQAPQRVLRVALLSVEALTDTGLNLAALDAPFPDAGHRAAELAFASPSFR